MLCRMRSWEDIKRDELAELFPGHDIWTVTTRDVSTHDVVFASEGDAGSNDQREQRG